MEGRGDRERERGRPAAFGPTVVCVRGPSSSGKTAVCERLIRTLGMAGLEVAYLKRTHHPLDLPRKASGRVWASGPAAMVISAPDRLQVTLPAVDGDLGAMLGRAPDAVDVLLLETHSPEPYPTILSAVAEPADGEEVIARWAIEGIDEAVPCLVAAVLREMEPPFSIRKSLRTAAAFHGGHVCPGIVLGARLVLHSAAELGLPLPFPPKRTVVVSETTRCAVDALQALTGATIGRRSLVLEPEGKLAATFFDSATGAALRVAARPGLRERVAAGDRDTDPHDAQLRAYLAWPAEDLFLTATVPFRPELFAKRERGHVVCASCAEEVSERREVWLEGAPFCASCAARASRRAAATPDL